jgi:hypothetical protein
MRLEEIRDKNLGLDPILYEPGNLSSAMTRNQIVRKFLATDHDLLVMVDDDVVPPPHLLDFLDPPEGYGMVGVPYPLWQSKPGLFLCAFKNPGDGLHLSNDWKNGWNDVDAIGTGCVAIPRAVLEDLGPNPFRFDNTPGRETVSEDFIFCEDLLAKGYKIGCWWDGWFADHVRAIGLAPLMEDLVRR